MTKKIKEKVYETGMEEIRNADFSGRLNVEEKYLSRGNFKAYTNLQNKDINFVYSPKAVELKGENKVLRVTSDVTSHEIDHHKYKGCVGCPQNVEKDITLFFEPMNEIFSKMGFSKEDVDYATNALQDSILHYDLKKNTGKGLQGIVTFLEDVGENCKNNKYTKFYEAHTKLNMFLWGTKEQKNLLNKFYTNDKKVGEVLKGFYGELNGGKFKGKTQVYNRSKCNSKKNLFGKIKRKWTDRKNKEIDFFDKDGIRNYLLDEQNWKDVSEVYAKHFSKIMEPNYAMPTPDHSGSGTAGRETENSENEGNPFKKERESRNFKKGRVMESGNSGKKIPKWIDKMEALDIYYEGLAEQLIIKAETFSDPETLRIAHYGERPFNPKRDNFKNIKFGFDEEGNFEIKKKPYSIETPINVKSSPRGFPKVKFGLIDVSTSMTSDISGGENIGRTSIIPWGDNSKYHWALMTQFGIFEYFKRNHLLTQNSISSAFFGENTKVVEGFQNVKDYLLHPNFEGDTQIDLPKIKNFFVGEGNLIYTIGDGLIGNWDSIKEDFINHAKNHAYVHLHMGTENKMTRDLKKANLEVIVAQEGKGIVEGAIDLTDKIFRS
ncbi:MAG: hypothetical protein NUV46_04910 [Nanoarchaeota archaeon]|nr:hypothetical protein [Nanoarchaeota archaeon]